jgi:hypothetical protein
VHAPTEDKCYDTKERFFEELKHVFHQFPKYHMNIMLDDLNEKMRRADNFI